MHFSAIIAAALTGLAVASPAHHFHDNQTAQIAYTYSNGTYTKPINVKVNSGTQKLPSTGIVTDVFVAPPFDGRHYVLTSCSFQAPTNKSLGAVSVRKPTTVPVHPPAAVGYVTCKSN
ncbi:uncharacterized protein TRIVIDRAFT_219305 [Trichoderma virens Gv29-8]|uniref:AA1-like domain-containing protein n=1 Tax=Hypocrea virens (strain Gv29-8 / FGSC 10586) TaxID=413071 RepID=G9MJ75_HYPVG|nr:uncharacterized protein TRIVIDRAFT_219305 [Trichoderma virens Gv29-8]EHK25538.1 hypothetical protein TRIVIDRAFT_219305 [Trichoderma virens Gv29-8]UKZ48642.1 hypothetical protein TrVGV298_002871 [Trichoderma virens]